MKRLLVCFIAIAMSIGFVLTPAMAQNEADPHYPNMYVDPGGIGDLLLFSLYDVRPVDGRGPLWENYIAIENTSGKWTAFHLRFRAWKKSIEVFDHVILLSPYDVFWMTLSLAQASGSTTYYDPKNGTYDTYEAGDVLMYSGDTHTLLNSALIYEGLGQTYWLDKFQDSLLVFNGFILEGTNDKAPKSEMQAGYIEAIGLWQLTIPSGDEDTHDLSEVVSNVHVDAFPAGASQINVDDALDALFYRFFTPAGATEAKRESNSVPNPPELPKYACDDNLTYVGCFSQYPVSSTIDSAWPDFIPKYATPSMKYWDSFHRPIKIERVDEPTFTGSTPLVAESPSKTRFGEDCGNVLAGNVAFGDPQDGKYQAENFIAVRNFRTDAKYDHHWSHAFYSTCDGLDYSQWQHRDGHYGGGIYFPASITNWYYSVAGLYTGGDANRYFWYYVNPDWATAAGPTLRDGNDFYGWNFNDINRWNNAEDLNPNANPAIKNYGLTRPFPAQNLTPEDNVWAFVHYINDIWSLDDLEAALGKWEIWNTFLRTRMSEGAKGNLNTDVVLTYPTKHNHVFFTDWPFMFDTSDGAYCAGDTLSNFVTATDVNYYWANLLDYRGNSRALFPELTNFHGLKSVEELLNFASTNTKPNYASEEFIKQDYNENGLTVAAWYQAKYLNGPIFVKATIWDNEQNSPKPPPDGTPPGSPWFPDPPPDRWAPHEVNIIRVGEASPTWVNATPPGTINDLNWLMASAVNPYNKGHFVIGQSFLEAGQRLIWDYGEDLNETFYEKPPHEIYNDWVYEIPPIGIVILNHDFGTSQEGVTRSAMSEWHYLQHWIFLNDCKWHAFGENFWECF